ncbi:MAG TPA: hypothetical protein VKA34_18725 [Balneolales bacterium]|nr:hypothetical protein [Balneolales bacterium]
MANKLWFRSRSGFDIEQNPWFCKAFMFVSGLQIAKTANGDKRKLFTE